MITRSLGIFLIAMSLMACGASSNPQDLTERERITTPGVARGIIPAAQADITVNGYKVTTSAGYFAGGIYRETKGYKVYTSLTGAMVADTYQEVIK